MTFADKMIKILLICITLWCTGGCAIKVWAPDQPAQPVKVAIADFGLHSSLLLPDEDGLITEYVYGEWHYYALRKKDTLNKIRALLIPTRAATGTRVTNLPIDSLTDNTHIAKAKLLKFWVSAKNVRQLTAYLEKRRATYTKSSVYDQELHMTYFHDDSIYAIFHTCNDTMRHWLRLLGCRVKGLGIVTNYKIIYPSPSDNNSSNND